MIDPPWNQKKSGFRKIRSNQGKLLDYKTLCCDDIKQLLSVDILPLMAKQHCLFVWTIDKFLIDCEKIFEDLDYKRHVRVIWNKQNGIAPAFTVRFSHEYLIWYYKSPLMKIDKEQRGKLTTVIEAKSREHSRKPDEAYSYVEKLYPLAKKIDVFSREKRNGWAQHGDECDKFML